MSEEKRAKIISMIRDTIREAEPTAQIILYGSRARGDAREDSDWDVLILLDKDRVVPNDYDVYSYPLREMGWDLDADINTILYTKKGWEQEHFTPFYHNVKEEGIAL